MLQERSTSTFLTIGDGSSTLSLLYGRRLSISSAPKQTLGCGGLGERDVDRFGSHGNKVRLEFILDGAKMPD